MAANYWSSTQRRFWQFGKDELEEMRQDIEANEQSLVQLFPLPQVRHLNIYINQRKATTHGREEGDEAEADWRGEQSSNASARASAHASRPWPRRRCT